jgi:UDP-GlcNAc:undecaprenyl-phosphate GlcNAc-1-phosphate transferase
MKSFGLTFAVSLLTSLVLTPVTRTLALRLNGMDRPDGDRKLHVQPVPHWGGVAVYLSLLVGLSLAREVWFTPGGPLGQLSGFLVFSAGLIFLLGFVDDGLDLRGRLKLLLQVLAVLPMLWAGYWFDEVALFGHVVHVGSLGLPLTILWLTGCINAMNLLDGMDGSTSVTSLIAIMATAAIAYSQGLEHIVLIAVALAGAIAGFLVYNLPPASIYLGDCGSTLIGFILGMLTLNCNASAPSRLNLAAPLVLLTVPVLDTSLAIVRRRLTGRRFDAGDRGHLHHRLLERGFTNWQALLILTIISLFVGAAALAASVWQIEALAWGAGLLTIVVLVRLRLFGHHELALVTRSMQSLYARLADRLATLTGWPGSRVSKRLTSTSFEEAWQALCAEITRRPCSRLEFRIERSDGLMGARTWTDSNSMTIGAHQWRLDMSFTPGEGSRCELFLAGFDTNTAEPLYLRRLAATLQLFGRHWASRLEQMPVARFEAILPEIRGSFTDLDGSTYRDAA